MNSNKSKQIYEVDGITEFKLILTTTNQIISNTVLAGHFQISDCDFLN
jgi:hypothetical protein